LGDRTNTWHHRFDITPKGQQIHIAFGEPSDFAALSSRHPCFRVESAEALLQLQARVWEHFERGGASAPVMADKPGGPSSGMSMHDINEQSDIKLHGRDLITDAKMFGGLGAVASDIPKRFFARDYAGNRLEFSL
jgi:hypothetical protein